MASLRGLDHIGEKIFKFHQGKDILNFRLVCKSWKDILENPMYWLKKLNKIGQSKKVFNETLILIRKAFVSGISETKIGHCLLIKYLKITEIRTIKNFANAIKRKLTNLMLRLPVLYCALISQKPDLELISFLAKTQSNVAKPIKCPPEIKYNRGRFSKYYASFTGRKNFEIDPLKDTIEGNLDLEVIEILVSELKYQISNQQFQKAFKLAVIKQNLEMCKLIGDKMHVFQDFDTRYDSPIRWAIQGENIQILQYLISKMKGTFNNIYNPYNPLKEIILNCRPMTIMDSSRVHNCIQMAKILLPKIEGINRIYRGTSFLSQIVPLIDLEKDASCAIEILKLIAPLCDFKEQNAEDLYKQYSIYSDQVYEILKPIIEKKLEMSSPLKKKLKQHNN